jgi:hypothetical protein
VRELRRLTLPGLDLSVGAKPLKASTPLR